jgi:hypothetical protein
MIWSSLNFLEKDNKSGGIYKALFFIGLILLGFSYYYQSEQNNQIDAINFKKNNLQRIQNQAKSTTFNSNVQANGQLRISLQQLNMPWNDFFLNLEKSVSSDIAILSINPDPTNSKILLEGVSRNTDSLLSLVDRINSTQFFYDAYIKQQNLKEHSAQMPIHFSIYASWRKE